MPIQSTVTRDRSTSARDRPKPFSLERGARSRRTGEIRVSSPSSLAFTPFSAMPRLPGAFQMLPRVGSSAWGRRYRSICICPKRRQPLPSLVADASQGRALRGPGEGVAFTKPLPILFGTPDENGRFWHRTPDANALTVDIFGSVFYLLTRYEEIVLRGRDPFERFPARSSLASAEGFLDRPIADEYVDLLWLAMLSLWPRLRRRETSFRLRLTHDVDRPWAALGNRTGAIAHAVGGDVVRRRDPALAARRIRSFFDARSGRVDRDPFNTFDLLMETSERYDLQSTFYFMAGASDPRFDGSYLMSDPPVRDLLMKINRRGHEVGLHASYETFRSAELMQAEFDALKAACRAVGFDQTMWGVRQHYLRFETPTTWRNQNAAGLAYDSTLGFADANGFRAGTCREYPVFDLLDRRTLELRERPLIFMDAASQAYLAMEFSGAAASVRALVATCRRHHGEAVARSRAASPLRRADRVARPSRLRPTAPADPSPSRRWRPECRKSDRERRPTCTPLRRIGGSHCARADDPTIRSRLGGWAPHALSVPRAGTRLPSGWAPDSPDGRTCEDPRGPVLSTNLAHSLGSGQAVRRLTLDQIGWRPDPRRLLSGALPLVVADDRDPQDAETQVRPRSDRRSLYRRSCWRRRQVSIRLL